MDPQHNPTLEQLKAEAYDIILLMEKCRMRIQQINTQIAQLTPRKADAPDRVA